MLKMKDGTDPNNHCQMGAKNETMRCCVEIQIKSNVRTILRLRHCEGEEPDIMAFRDKKG